MQRYQMHEYLAMVSEDLTLNAFESLGLSRMIDAALDDTDGWEKKKCPLSSRLLMILVLSLNLYRNMSIFDVFKGIVSNLRSKKERISLEPVTEEAVYHGRYRLGVEPVRALFKKTAESIVMQPSFHGYCVNIIDGFRADVPDTESNDEYFGRTKGSHGESGFPQVKAVTLAVAQTRETRAAVFGPCYMSEQPIAEMFVQLLGKHDLVIVDRGLPSFQFFTTCEEREAAYLARISSTWKPRKLEPLGAGDWRVEIRARVPVPPSERRQKNQQYKWVYKTVRMIEYTFKSTGEKIRLLTNLDDVKTFGALELAQLYHERWEIEIAYDELKTHLESTAKGIARTVFRSQHPEGVEQEAFAMLALYNLVRRMMVKAAKRARIPADEISFVGTLNVIRLAISRFAFASESNLPRLARQLLDDIAQEKLDRPRRKRQCPRVIKKRQSPYPRKRAKDREKYFDFTAEIQLTDSDYLPWAA